STSTSPSAAVTVTSPSATSSTVATASYDRWVVLVPDIVRSARNRAPVTTTAAPRSTPSAVRARAVELRPGGGGTASCTGGAVSGEVIGMLRSGRASAARRAPGGGRRRPAGGRAS